MLPRLHLYHVTPFRSTRVLWMYLELHSLYKGDLTKIPPLTVHEFMDVNKFRNDKPDWFLEINPNGKVPTVIDENLESSQPLFESGAICFHMLDSYDKAGLLLPRSDPTLRALYHNVAFYCTGTLDNLCSTSSPIQRAKLEYEGGEANMNTVINPMNKIAWRNTCAPFFESLLEKSGGPYLFGETFTAADVIFGHCLFGLDEKMKSPRGEGKSWLDPSIHPRICDFQKELLSRPNRQKAYSSPADWCHEFQGLSHQPV